MKNKIWLFIDQANLWSAYKKVWKIIDFRKLLIFIEKEFNWKIEFKSIYFAYPKEWTRDYDISWIHKFWTFLKKELWFHIKKKELKQIELRNNDWEIVLWLDWSHIIKEKWNLDIELTMDVMQTYNHFDIMVLFSWDSDFYPLVSFLQFKWKKVYVFSTVNNISSELMHHSNKYYDFCEIDEIWWNKLKHRNEKS
jgi:uncharacterized LabA/DUF88 family protein